MAMTELGKNWKWHALVFGAAIAICSAFLVHIMVRAQPVPLGLPETGEMARTLEIPPEEISAEAAIVYDPSDGTILYAKNADMQLPLASLTKLAAASVVLDADNASTPVVITPEDTAEVNGIADMGLRSGQRWSIGELVRYGLFASSNNAMAAAARASAGGGSTVDAMNDQARSLGISEARFYNPTGLDVNQDLSGGYGSARDVAVLAAAFYRDHPDFFEITMRAAANFGPGGEKVAAYPTAAPIQDMPGVLAAKTGYTDLARGNMVALFDAEVGRPLVAAVLHSTKDGRFEDIRKLIEAARAAK